VEDDKSKPNSLGQDGASWVSAVQIFTDISTWIIVPIVGALIFGKMLDKRFGTEPVIFLVLAGLGFIVTCFGIIRIVKNYLKKIKDTENK
jgi:F0F1-type ATP synthase assembly protein I